MNKLSRIQSFFLEMAFVIFFFSLAAAVVIRFFAAGNQLSQHSQDANGAMLAAQSWVEQLNVPEAIPDESEKWVFYYNSQWNPTEEPSDFQMTVSVQPEQTAAGTLCRYDISVMPEGGSEELFHLNTARYWPEKGDVS